LAIQLNYGQMNQGATWNEVDLSSAAFNFRLTR